MRKDESAPQTGVVARRGAGGPKKKRVHWPGAPESRFHRCERALPRLGKNPSRMLNRKGGTKLRSKIRERVIIGGQKMPEEGWIGGPKTVKGEVESNASGLPSHVVAGRPRGRAVTQRDFCSCLGEVGKRIGSKSSDTPKAEVPYPIEGGRRPPEERAGEEEQPSLRGRDLFKRRRKVESFYERGGVSSCRNVRQIPRYRDTKESTRAESLGPLRYISVATHRLGTVASTWGTKDPTAKNSDKQ